VETYLVVRAHGLKTRLLGRREYEDIVRGKRGIWDFRDYSAIREDMDLKEKINQVYRVYTSRLGLLARIAPDYGEFIYALLDRLEVENVKIQLRNIYGRRGRAYFYPYGRRLSPAQLEGVASEEALWELVGKTPYMEGVRLPAFRAGVAERELFLDNIYYLYLLRSVNAGPLRKKLSPVTDVIRLEYLVKLFYWKTALGDDFWAIIARHPKPFSIGERSFDALLVKLDVSQERVSELLSQRKLTELMNEMTLALVRYASFALRPYSVELPFIYTFNIMAYIEAQNLERIILGLDTGLPEETILSSLVYIK